MSTKSQITADDIQGMVRHWLSTPVGSYLGSDYGNDIKSFLQSPMAAGADRALISKLYADVPLLSALPSDAISIFYQDELPDKRNLIVSVSGVDLVSDGRVVIGS